MSLKRSFQEFVDLTSDDEDVQITSHPIVNSGSKWSTKPKTHSLSVPGVASYKKLDNTFKRRKLESASIQKIPFNGLHANNNKTDNFDDNDNDSEPFDKFDSQEDVTTSKTTPSYTFTYDSKQSYQSVIQRAQQGINGLQKLKQRASFNKRLYSQPNHVPLATPGWAQTVHKVKEESVLKGSLTEEQMGVVNLALAGHSLFFTGAAGTGKSFVLRVMVEELQIKHGYSTVFVTASTGMAACNIQGVTLHSFAGIGLAKGTKEELCEVIKKKKHVIQRWRRANVLVIDEVSMIGSDFFTKVEYVARYARKSNLPFGGMQVVLCGDFFQLPPVGEDGFCFESEAWKHIPINIELKQVLRQKNPEFIKILNELRMGIVTSETEKILNSRVHANVTGDDGIQPTKLHSHRADVSLENKQNLDALEGKLMSYTANDDGDSFHLQQLDAHCQAPKILEIKIGAQVMLLKNIDFQSSIVNGARGIVVGFTSDKNKVGVLEENAQFYYPVVRFSDEKERIITLETWRIELAGQVKASRVQLPLVLAYAMSIHKSQGMSIEKVDLSLANIFTYGQAYVALSRVTSLEGLRLSETFVPSKIKTNPKVLQFYKHFRESNYDDLIPSDDIEIIENPNLWNDDGDNNSGYEETDPTQNLPFKKSLISL